MYLYTLCRYWLWDRPPRQVYEPDGLELEFVTASGKIQALVTLNVKDLRPVPDSDLIAVRSVA